MTPTIREVVSQPIIENLTELISCLDSNSDIRVCLSRMIPVALALKGFLDAYNDPDIMFFCYTVMDQLGNVQNSYVSSSNEWYQLNADNVSRLRTALLSYCQAILSSADNSDLQELLEATKAFFSKFHKLARLTTADVKK